MENLVNKLVSNGWYLQNIDYNKEVYQKRTNKYQIIPPDERQNWTAEFKTVNYGALVIYIPQWAFENHKSQPALPGMPARFGKRSIW